MVAPTVGGHGGAGTGGLKVHVKATVWVPTVIRVTTVVMNMPDVRKENVVSDGGWLERTKRWKTWVPSADAGSTDIVPSAGAAVVVEPTVDEPDWRNR